MTSVLVANPQDENKQSPDKTLKPVDTMLLKAPDAPDFIVITSTQKVEKIIPQNPNDPCLYKIYVTRFDISNIIELTATHILNPTIFRWKWLGLFDEPLELDKQRWAKILLNWMRGVKVGSEDAVSTEQYLIDAIIVDIQLRKTSEDKETVLHNTLLRLVDPQTNHILIPSSHITQILRQEGVNMELRRLRYLLKPYLAGNTLQLRVGRARIRFWQFNSEKLEINLAEDASAGEEGEEGEDLE